MYKYLLKPILFQFDPEDVHNLFVTIGEFLGKFKLTRSITNYIYGFREKHSPIVVDGIKYKTPVILSAGFDYNGRLTQILPFVGFGGVEVGSVTARPCAGNDKPRLTRLKKSKALIVYKGLKNEGVDKVIKRLKAKERIPGFVIGVSIARTNDEKSSGVEEGIADYYYSLKRLVEEDVGDYYAINISCPNAFGGETFATKELLNRLLLKLSEIKTNKPIYVKLPINIEWEKAKELIEVVLLYDLSGVIIGNLNKDYSYVLPSEIPEHFRGGISGKPCRELSTNLIKKAHEEFGEKITIFGVGGIMSPEDAMEKINAGAKMLELITGMIYEGPSLMKNIAKAYFK